MDSSELNDLPEEGALSKDVLEEVRRLREKVQSKGAESESEPFSFYLKLWVDTHFDQWVKQRTVCPGSERREHPRVGSEIPFRYRMIPDPNETDQEAPWLKGHLDNISAGGLLFSSEERFNSSQQLEFEIKFRGKQEHPLQVKGEIVRLQQDDEQNIIYYGIRFFEINEEARKQIANYVTRTILSG